jgi:hypothetical protein
MDKSIIEALKKNTEAVCLMPEELRKAMLCMDSKLFECLQSVSGVSRPEWRRVTSVWTHDTDATQTFKLNDDYQPAPSVIECEVRLNEDNHLWYYTPSGVEFRAGCISRCIHDPNFIGFKYEDGKILPYSVRYVPGIKNVSGLFLGDIESGEYSVERPTHVLFRRAK